MLNVRFESISMAFEQKANMLALFHCTTFIIINTLVFKLNLFLWNLNQQFDTAMWLLNWYMTLVSVYSEHCVLWPLNSATTHHLWPILSAQKDLYYNCPVVTDSLQIATNNHLFEANLCTITCYERQYHLS